MYFVKTMFITEREIKIMCDFLENIAIIIMDNVNKLNSKCHTFKIKS